MGRFTDSLPAIRAQERFEAILRFTGCKQLGCRLDVWDDMATLGIWVRHNEDVKSFEIMAGRHRDDGMVVVVDCRTGASVPLIPMEMAAWISDAHRPIAARLEAERQAAIDADGWQQHAEMVTLNG